MNRTFVLEPAKIIEFKLYMKDHWMVHFKVGDFIWIRNPSWPKNAGQSFNIRLSRGIEYI